MRPTDIKNPDFHPSWTQGLPGDTPAEYIRLIADGVTMLHGQLERMCFRHLGGHVPGSASRVQAGRSNSNSG